MELHVVCRDERGVTRLEDGTFESRAWKVSENTARNADILALHQRKAESSYLQGEIIDCWLAEDGSGRWIFRVRADDSSLPWPGDPSPGPTLTIRH